MNILEDQRYTVFTEIEGSDFIEVTEWTNGEGIDIDVEQGRRIEKISITYEEFRIIKKLIKRCHDRYGKNINKK